MEATEVRNADGIKPAVFSTKLQRLLKNNKLKLTEGWKTQPG